MKKSVAMALILMPIILVLTSCQSAKTKSPPQADSVSSSVKVEPEKKSSEPVVIPTPPRPSPTSPESSPTVVVPAPRPSVKTMSHIGLIFSGGGAKAWAHLGVLKELQKYKVPVTAVGGMEWGAVVAAIYGQNLSANEVEWELSKFKDLDQTENFIKAVFTKKTVADMKTSFVCPSINLKTQTAYLLNRGNLDQFIPFCLSSVGLVKPYNQSVSLMSDVSSLAQHMRSTGAQKIILINVLSNKNQKPFIKSIDSAENQIWSEAAAQLSKKNSLIDEVIEINTADYEIQRFDQRREISSRAQDQASLLIKKLADKYNF